MRGEDGSDEGESVRDDHEDMAAEADEDSEVEESTHSKTTSKSSKSNTGSVAVEEEDDDLDWYRKETGDEPDTEMVLAAKLKHEQKQRAADRSEERKLQQEAEKREKKYEARMNKPLGKGLVPAAVMKAKKKASGGINNTPQAAGGPRGWVRPGKGSKRKADSQPTGDQEPSKKRHFSK